MAFYLPKCSWCGDNIGCGVCDNFSIDMWAAVVICSFIGAAASTYVNGEISSIHQIFIIWVDICFAFINQNNYWMVGTCIGDENHIRNKLYL